MVCYKWGSFFGVNFICVICYMWLEYRVKNSKWVRRERKRKGKIERDKERKERGKDMKNKGNGKEMRKRGRIS